MSPVRKPSPYAQLRARWRAVPAERKAKARSVFKSLFAVAVDMSFWVPLIFLELGAGAYWTAWALLNIPQVAGYAAVVMWLWAIVLTLARMLTRTSVLGWKLVRGMEAAFTKTEQDGRAD